VALKQYYPVYPGESLTLPTKNSETTFMNIDSTDRGRYAYQDKHIESRPANP
jgi:hypothetical protein